MFNFDILHKFNHSDLAALIAPRAFMIEIGSRDSVEIEPRRRRLPVPLGQFYG
jgi:hypothetical protein